MRDAWCRNLFIVNIALFVTEYCTINVSVLIKEVTESCVQSKKCKKVSGGYQHVGSVNS